MSKRNRKQTLQTPAPVPAVPKTATTERAAPVQRRGETEYICTKCGETMRINKSRNYPDFLLRDLVCPGCGRETDHVHVPRKKVTL